MADQVILYDYWRSSASYRVRIALNLAQISYDAIAVDLVKGEHMADDYQAVNPQALVPTLDLDGERFTQSLAILEYLNTTRGLGLLPEDAVERTKVSAAAMAIAVDLHPVCNLKVVGHATKGEEPQRTDWMRHFITPGLEAFEALIEGYEGAFCCGETPSLADICLMPQIYNAERWGAEYRHLPNVVKAKAACDAHPAFQAAHPDAVNPNG